MSEQETLLYILAILGIPFLYGVVMGWNGKIVVFRNIEDLWFALLLVLMPFITVFIFSMCGLECILYIAGVLYLLLILVFCYRTYIDNDKKIFSTLLALYTKIPLCILCIFQVFAFIGSISKPYYKRRLSLSTLISALLLIPLIMKLVRDKEGLYR